MISILTPTRGRPDGYAKMVESVKAKTKGDYELLAGLDADDEAEYPHIEGVRYITCTDDTQVGVTNRLAREAKGDVLMFMGDDDRCMWDGWDETVMEYAIHDGIYVLCVQRRTQHEGFYMMMSRGWYELYGRFWPDRLQHYADSWLYDVACFSGRMIIIPLPIFEHAHYRMSDSPKDDTYKLSEGRHRHDRDLEMRAKDMKIKEGIEMRVKLREAVRKQRGI